jgi:eukaryotic-like serine/threonine-protein kinase
MDQSHGLPCPSERELFFEALEKATSAERASYLDEACGKDRRLRHRVQVLLDHHFHQDGFMKDSAVKRDDFGADTAEVTESPGTVIGHYRLVEQIGEGGFGVIYEAEQLEPVQRKVALKIIKLGMDTKEVIARFDAERQALARMDHPNIARVFDAGATHSGRPFFVMELVPGIPITAFCDQHRLSTDERLDLFLKVCYAVQHAHQKGVIHRDLKPTNILVTSLDHSPVPKVIDFGVAKAIGQRLTRQTLVTRVEQLIGTPVYMSPEQAEWSGLDVDTRSDVYTLGVLLFELLTGTTPFEPATINHMALDEVRRIIRETEPPKPSTRLHALGQHLTDIAQRRRTAPAQLPKLIRGDLDWIVMKALEKDRRRRYDTVNAFAQDIEHHLHHEPVKARPPGQLYRAGKFVRRHRAGVAVATLILVALVTGLSVALLGLRQATRERNRALAAEQTVHATLNRMEIQRAKEFFSRDDAPSGLAMLAFTLRSNPDDRSIAEWLVNELTQRSFAVPLIEPIQHEDMVHFAQFSPDGTQVLTACRNNTARLWNAATGRPVTPPLEHERDRIRAGEYLEGLHPLHADWRPDGARIATASADGSARLWDARTGQPATDPLLHGELVTWIRFSPDSKLVVTACKDGRVRLWSAETGWPAGPMLSHSDWVNSVEFSPDGKRLVSASDDATARVWEIPSGQQIGAPMRHARWVRYACFSPDGRRILTASQDSTARIWDAATGQPMSPPLPHRQIVVAASFSPDGRWVATASFDKTARIWDAFTGEPVGEPLRHRSTVRSVAFSPDGFRVVTASEDGTARIWDARSGEPLSEPISHAGSVWSAQFSPDGQRLVTASSDGTARIWEVKPGQAIGLRLPHTSGVNWIQWSADGHWAYTCGSGMWSWSTANGVNQHHIYSPTFPIGNVSPDNRFFATVIETNSVCIWDLSRAGPPPVEPLLRHAAAVKSIAFSLNGQWLVTASADRTAQVWDVTTRKPVGPPLRHEDVVFNAQFSHDSQFVVTASADQTARVWNTVKGSLALPPLRHAGAVTLARFSPNGRWIATASEDRTARIWDARHGRPIGPPLIHNRVVNDARFSPDSTRLVTASLDNTARIWQVPAGRPIGEPLSHEDSVLTAEFSPAGDWVLTASRDGTARVWDASTSQPVAEPLKHTRRIAAAHFSPDGRWVLTASEDRTAAIWRLLRPQSPPPTWLPDLAESVAGKRMKSTGMTEETPHAEWFRLKREYEQDRSMGGYERWAAWFFADRARRPVAPDASITVADLIQERTRSACHMLPDFSGWIEELLRYSPTNALGLARLAQVRVRETPNPSAADLSHWDWLTWKAIALAPNEPVVQWARALALKCRGDMAGALSLAERAHRAGYRETCFLVDYTSLLVEARRLSDANAVFAEALKWKPESEPPFETHLRETFRNEWADHLARAESAKTLRVYAFACEGFHPRPLDLSPLLLDLSSYYSMTLTKLWLNTLARLDGLSDFVDSPVYLDGVAFDVRGCVLAADESPQQAKFKEIPVQVACRRLHFLQTTQATWPPGTLLGSYRVHFADGDQREIPIVYGRDVAAFVNHPPATEEAASVAWEQQSADGTRLRLYRLTWNNPRPNEIISQIEFHSSDQSGEPVLLAITLEP